MNTSKLSFTLAAMLLFVLGMFTACESTDSGSTQVTTNNYYGVGFYDPWYHGDYHDDHDVIVTPPPSDGSPPSGNPPSSGNRPDNGLHPAHPIASPPQVSRPSPRPTPSIPSTPRPASRPASRPGGRR